MRCSACGTENRADRKFCAECGAALSLSCARCGTVNLAGERFCGDCGTDLRAVAETPREATAAAPGAGDRERVAERRLVTVLFADLVGFTSVAEGRDPEAVRDLLSSYFAATRRVIERYGGTVEKFIGDAVMAVWGTPVAREDDAERAVRAGVDLVDAIAGSGSEAGVARLAARVGIVTGEAAVTIGATGQGMVAGDLVNTASRLQGAAEAGTVLVDEATERSSRDAIVFEPVGALELRGKDVRVPAARAVRIVAGRGGAGRADRLEAPFVGRAAELRALKEALDATTAEGRARFVSVVGQAGIGKSRLAWELEKYVDGIAARVPWNRGRSPAYGEAIAFWALAEMIRGRFGIAETDDTPTTAAKLTDGLARHVADADARRWIEPHLRVLLGLDESAGGDRADQFAAWRALFDALADRGTTVLVFEDLQWADDGLLEFIDSIFEWLRDRPILVAALARPELLDRRPALGAASRNALRLHLEPLSPDEIRQLLQGVAPDLQPQMLDSVVARSDGIPLFAIELVRMLRGGDPARFVDRDGVIAIPPSLHALVAARLDSLDPADRGLLHDAAVLGQTFTVDALASVTGEGREAIERRAISLVRKEFLVLDADPRSPERGQYGFVQSVVREVAYGTLSRRDRRSRHLAAARYFETLEDDEVAPVLAAHYLEAYRAAPDDEQGAAVRAQARIALRASADRAAALHNYEAAIRELERGLELTDDAMEQAAIMERQAGHADAAAQFERAKALAQQAHDLYDDAGDRAGAARAIALLGSIELKTGRHTEARAHLERAVTSLDPEADADVYARVAAQIARVHMHGNRPAETLEWAERALAAAGPPRLVDVIADALNTRGVALQSVRRLDESLATIEAAIAMAAANGLAATELRARFNLAGRRFVEDPRHAIALLRGAVELAERTGRRDWHGLCAGTLADELVTVGEWEDGLAVADAIPHDELSPGDAADLLLLRAFIGAARGDEAGWQRALAEAQTLAAGDSHVGRSEAWLIRRIEVAMFFGRPAEAVELAEQVRSTSFAALARLYGTRAAIWRADEALARRLRAERDTTRYQGRLIDLWTLGLDAGIAALEGRRDEAILGYGEAVHGMRELRAPFLLTQVLLDACYALGPDTPGVDAFADEAQGIFESLGATALLARLDDALRRRDTERARASAPRVGASRR